MKGATYAPGAKANGLPPDAETEARSPPGQWRLLAISMVCWATTCWAILEPGRGTAVAVGSGLIGLVLLGWAGLRRLSAPSGGLRPPHRVVSTFTSAPISVSVLVLCAAALLLIGTRVHTAETIRADPLLKEAAVNGTQVSFEANLIGFPELRVSPFGDRAWVRIEAIRPAGAVPMLLWLSDTGEVPSHWGPGTQVEVTAKLKAQSAQDSAAYTASPKLLKEVERSQPEGRLSAKVGATAALLRTTLVQHARGMAGAELVPGFAVGDTSLVSEQLSTAMLDSSLTHLTAVSGSNTGLVIAAVVWCVARLGAGRKLRTLAAICGLLAFVVIVGPDASVQRAAIMATVLLAGTFGGRRSTAFPALGIAVLTLLVIDPWQALQAGFSLSVAATCGILLSAAPIDKWLRRRARLPRALSLTLAVALAAQLFCGPLVLLLQPGVPAVGVLANVIAAPAAPLGTGIGLIATVLGPLSPSLATLAVRMASWPARWVAATAEVCTEIPGGRWHWPEGWPGALLLAGCQLALVVAWALRTGWIGLPGINRVKPRNPWQVAQPVQLSIRSASAALTSLSLGIFFVTTALTPYVSRLSTPPDWVIVACNVGQGDALLVRHPKRPEEVMLIDTGDSPESLDQCLKLFGVERVSLLILTHDDRDHVGALESVLGRVDTALISPTLQGEITAERPVVRLMDNAAVPYRIGVAGDGRSSEDTGLSWRILAPQPTTVPTVSNAASLVLLIEVEDHRFLMLADTGYEEQARLQASANLTEIEVVKIAHHGSRDQDLTLIERTAPTWGLVSVGAGNGYGHPNENTLAAFARAGTHTLRTDAHGSVALVLQPDGTLAPWVERPAESKMLAGMEPSAMTNTGSHAKPSTKPDS